MLLGYVMETTAPWNSVWMLLRRLKGELTCHNAVLFLGVCLKDLKSVFHRDICSSTFITAFFTIARKRNQPKSSSAEECETRT